MNASMTILSNKSAEEWDWFYQRSFFHTGAAPASRLDIHHISFCMDATRTWRHLNRTNFGSESEYATKVTDDLYGAFEYARKCQAEAAQLNAMRRDVGRTDQQFNKGDSVFYWYDKSSEGRTDIGRVTIPGKWRNWWHGPFGIVGKITQNVYTVNVEGKETKANVNRLSKHKPFNTLKSDTSVEPDGWLVRGGKVPPDAVPVAENQQVQTRDVKAGEMIVFPTDMTNDFACPFGVGKVMKLMRAEN